MYNKYKKQRIEINTDRAQYISKLETEDDFIQAEKFLADMRARVFQKADDEILVDWRKGVSKA